MNAFAAAVDILFQDPNMAADAIYVTRHGEVIGPVRIIRRATDPEISYRQTPIAADATVFDMRVSEAVTPGAGDRLMIGTAHYDVQGVPTRDELQLVWTLNTRPAA